MYLDNAISSRERRALSRRVELYVDEQMEAAFPKHYGSRIELVLASGVQRTSVVLDPHGLPGDVTDAERIEKFGRLAAYAKSAERIEQIASAVRRTEMFASVRELLEPIRR